FYPDPVDAAGRRHRLRLALRPDRPQETVDDIDRLVLGLQPACRSRAELLVAFGLPHCPRHRYGCGMACRRGAGDGNMAATFARVHGLGATGFLGPWSAAVQRRLCPAL